MIAELAAARDEVISAVQQLLRTHAASLAAPAPIAESLERRHADDLVDRALAAYAAAMAGHDHDDDDDRAVDSGGAPPLAAVLADPDGGVERDDDGTPQMARAATARGEGQSPPPSGQPASGDAEPPDAGPDVTAATAQRVHQIGERLRAELGPYRPAHARPGGAS